MGKKSVWISVALVLMLSLNAWAGIYDITTVTGYVADRTRPSINDSGEIVWAEAVGDYHQIISNVRGQLTSDSWNHLDPVISDTGEVVWVGWINEQWEVVSSTRGQIAPGWSPGVNSSGEVVWTDTIGDYQQVVSSTRGQMTFDDVHHRDPYINDDGEIVWTESIVAGYQIIRSNVRGVLVDEVDTRAGNPALSDLGELVYGWEVTGVPSSSQILSDVTGFVAYRDGGPNWGQDVNSAGWIVFEDVVEGGRHIYLARPVPLPTTALLFLSGTSLLAAFRRQIRGGAGF